MEKYLLAVDGSEASQKAAEKALELAQKTGATVAILSVNSRRDDFGDQFVEVEVIEKARTEQTNEAIKKAEKIFEESGVDTEKIVKEGNPSEEICKVANNKDYSMIIMGSRGLSGMKRTFLGSIANEVVQNANKPVLIVKEDLRHVQQDDPFQLTY